MVPQEISQKRTNFTIMKVELCIKSASPVIKMSNCPKNSEGSCGIMYRAF